MSMLLLKNNNKTILHCLLFKTSKCSMFSIQVRLMQRELSDITMEPINNVQCYAQCTMFAIQNYVRNLPN